MTSPTQPANLPSGWGVPKNLIFDEVLPSGAKVRLRKLEMEDLISMGLLDQLDTFSPEAISGVNELQEKSSEEKKEYGKRLIELFKMVDKIVVAALLSPKVLPKPENLEDPRIEGQLYVDGIPQEDRMHIFETAAEDMSSFLRIGEGQSGDVGSVEAGSVVPNEAVPASGALGS